MNLRDRIHFILLLGIITCIKSAHQANRKHGNNTKVEETGGEIKPAIDSADVNSPPSGPRSERGRRGSSCPPGYHWLPAWCLTVQGPVTGDIFYSDGLGYGIYHHHFEEDYKRAMAVLKKTLTDRAWVKLATSTYKQHPEKHVAPSSLAWFLCVWHACDCYLLEAKTGQFSYQPCWWNNMAIVSLHR